MPFLYTFIIILVSINFLLGLPKVVDLVQTKVASVNVIANYSSVLGSNTKSVEKKILSPKWNGVVLPPISATSAIALDLDSEQFLFVKDPHKKVPIASTTKIMTALIASEYFKVDDILIVPDVPLANGSTMGLKPGEKLTARSLLYGLLLNSGNDAAFTLAANSPGGVSGFVEAMNQKTKTLGLFDTHFDNPAGFDSPNHFSSASDLAKIAGLIVTNPQLSTIVATKDATVASIDRSNIHTLKNLNKLLGEEGILGIKTGTTPLAKENFVGLVERNGRKILTVVLGSDDRFGETSTLINWAFQNFTWE